MNTRVTLKINNVLSNGKPLILASILYSDAMNIIKYYRSWIISFDRDYQTPLLKSIQSHFRSNK